MVRSENGEVKIVGDKATIFADCCCILQALLKEDVFNEDTIIDMFTAVLVVNKNREHEKTDV